MCVRARAAAARGLNCPLSLAVCLSPCPVRAESEEDGRSALRAYGGFSPRQRLELPLVYIL